MNEFCGNINAALIFIERAIDSSLNISDAEVRKEVEENLQEAKTALISEADKAHKPWG